jgi:hypothetical protein
LRRKIIALKQSAAYEQTSFTHFRELLEEREALWLGFCFWATASFRPE